MPRMNLLVIATIIAAAAAAYAGTSAVPFQFDDVAAVAENATVRTLSLDALRPPANQSPTAGRPLVNLSLALNYAAGGLDVTGYHIVNLTLHIVCALLVFALAGRVLDDRWLAGVIAIAWAVHPLNTGAVTYISGRTELLMALCYLTAMYAAARAHTGSPRGWMTAAVMACAAGMACKESMVTAPVAIVLFDRAYVYTGFSDAFRRRGPFYACLCATWLVLVWLLWDAPHSASAGFDADVSVATYLLNQAVVIPEYLRLALWPNVLLFAYGEVRPLTVADVGLMVAIVPALFAAAVWLWVRRPAIGYPAIWFFLTLAPTSSLVPIATEAGAARRMYLPLIGVIALVVIAGARVGRVWRSRPAYLNGGVAVAAIVIAALTMETSRQNREFMSAEALWRGSLAEWPSALAHLNLANALKAKGGARDEVIEHLRAAAAMSPIERYTLGAELVEQGRPAEAIPELERVLAENPGNERIAADARNALARALTDDGVALLRSGRATDAVAPLRRVADEHRGDAAAQINAAAALATAGDFAAAAQFACRAIALAPSDATARDLLRDIRAAAAGSHAPTPGCDGDR